MAGDPARPAIVLLHGWPQSRRLFDRVIDQLATDFFTIAFDLPEIGDSRGAPHSAEKTVLADVVLHAAEKAGAKSILIAGLDVGGMIAFAAARDHARRIVGAVVMNTVIPGLDPWARLLSEPQIWHFAFHQIPQLPERLVNGRERAYFDFFYDVLSGYPDALPEEHRAAYTQAYLRPEALRAGFDWYRAMEADARRNAVAKRMTTPILYLRGDADGRSVGDYVRGLRAAGAQRVSKLVIPHSGEFTPVDAPDALARALRDFSRSCLVPPLGPTVCAKASAFVG
jgi:pimeloyl-ACP methyl ester carboxylesterase